MRHTTRITIEHVAASSERSYEAVKASLVPEVALYAPFRLAVYEGEGGTTFADYDRFSSLLAQYHRPEIAAVAQLVEQKLEALVAEATGAERT